MVTNCNCLLFFYGRTSQGSAFSLLLHRQSKSLAKRKPDENGRLLKKLQKPYTVVNRNSQSYTRENVVSLNTTSFRNCRLSGSFRFLRCNNTDLNICLKFSTPHFSPANFIHSPRP